MESHHVRYLLVLQVKVVVADHSKGHRGHSRSPTVFLPITWDPNRREMCDFCHYVRLGKAHRMMYILTYLVHRVTLTYLDLRSKVDLDLSRSNYTSFDAPWREKHDRVKIIALSFKTNKLLLKSQFGQIWPFDLWWPQFWTELKNDRSSFGMLFNELSNAVFRIALRCTGAEIDGGVQTPPAGGGKSRGPSGRGITSNVFLLDRSTYSDSFRIPTNDFWPPK